MAPAAAFIQLMKIACCYHPRIHTGWGKFHFVADALRTLGHDVRDIQTLAELKTADAECDLVLFEQRGPASLNIPDMLDFATQRRSVWIQWYFDLNFFYDSLPLEQQAPVAPSLEIMRVMDLVLVKERSRLADYRNAGIPAVWLDQACPSAMRQAALQESPPYDVILWGSSRRSLWAQRWDDIAALIAAGFKVGWGATDSDLPHGVVRLPACQPLELPDLISQGKICLVVDARQDIDGYWSDRIWLAAGAGACCLRRISFGQGPMPAYGYLSTLTLLSLVDALCRDFEQRKQAGEMFRQRTLLHDTYENRCRKLVRYAEDIATAGRAKQDVSQMPWFAANQDRYESREVDQPALSSLHAG